MKKIGVVFLGIGFGIICYILFSLFAKPKEIISPIETTDTNKVVQQNTK